MKKNIEFSNYSKIADSISYTVARFEEILKRPDLPNELKNKVENIIKEFETYDMSQHMEKLTTLSGDVLTSQEALQIIVAATKCNEWEEEKEDENEDEDDNYYNSEFFAQNFQVNVTNIQRYVFTCETDNRSDVYKVEFICLPGCAYVNLESDRASFNLQKLIKNNKLKSEIKKEI